MKKILFCLAGLLSVSLLFASNRYVKTDGNNGNDGKSWATAKATISAGLSSASVGDTVFVAAGVYKETISIKDGIHVFGGYDAKTGARDLDAYPTILDGTDSGKFILVKYDNGCTNPTKYDGLTLQNAESSSEGGAAFIRENCTLNNCIITKCKSASNGGGVYNSGGTISNCIIELCEAGSSGGAVDNRGGVVMNTIIRGCGGKYGSIRNRTGGVVYNCLFYNNAAIVDGWPNSGGIFNEAGGTAYNCTLVNNWGSGYAGCHSEGVMFNCILWNNQAEEGFADPVCFISSSAHNSGAGDNAADSYFEAVNFTYKLDAGNLDAKGPHFISPTTFVGIPSNEAEIAAMRAADFRLMNTSPLLDLGRSANAPATDINGVARPKGNGVDMGCYEYDPNAKAVALKGIALNTDTLFVEEESTSAFAVIYTPKDATNRKVTWTIGDKTIASIDANGAITGLKVGKTTVTAKAEDGGFTATGVVVVTEKPIIIIHREVLAADSLYPMDNYTVPSFIPFWVAKEAARKDSTDANLQAMRDAIKTLVPKTEPYDVVANINGDPTTRMAFCWFTNEGVTDGKVQLVAKANATASDFSSAIEVDAEPTTTKPLHYAVSTSGIIKATGMSAKQSYIYVSHKAIAEDLTPGTDYCYRVGYEGHWSSIYHFRTADTNQGDFSFIYMTDSHLQDAEYVENARWCAQAVAKNESDARFCVFPGDFVETGTAQNSEWEWERWFEESLRPVIEQMPIVPTDGNHDDSELQNYTYHFNTDNQFKINAKVKPQFDGVTYSFVYGDVLFLVYSKQDYWRGSYSYSKLTSTYLTKDVGNWFREQVRQHPEAKYRVALVHKNVFSGSGHQEDEETPLFRATMLPIFKDCEIDLALQGHDHCYEIIGPVNPDTRTVVEGAVTGVKKGAAGGTKNMTGLSGGTYCVDDGTLYFIGATCGRKRYDPYTRAEMDAQKDKTKVENYFDLFTGMFGQPGAPSYTRINVSDEALELKSYTVDKSGNSTEFNTIRVVRNKKHTLPVGFDEITFNPKGVNGVYDLLGNRYDEPQGSGFYIVVDEQGTRKIFVQ